MLARALSRLGRARPRATGHQALDSLRKLLARKEENIGEEKEEKTLPLPPAPPLWSISFAVAPSLLSPRGAVVAVGLTAPSGPDGADPVRSQINVLTQAVCRLAQPAKLQERRMGDLRREISRRIVHRRTHRRLIEAVFETCTLWPTSIPTYEPGSCGKVLCGFLY